MAEPVERDARGIVHPERATTRFSLERDAPSPAVARFVDRYWIVRWDLTGRPSHTQRVLAHPVVNVVFTAGTAEAFGPTTAMTARTLTGQGWAVGVMFRPAGFRPLLRGPVSRLTDRSVPATTVLGSKAGPLCAAVERAGPADAVAVLDRYLAEVLPRRHRASEDTTVLAERAAADRSVTRVDVLARGAGWSVRTLQRRFRDHVGIGAKAVIRRYRVFDVAEKVRHGEPVDWGGRRGRARLQRPKSPQPRLPRLIRPGAGRVRAVVRRGRCGARRGRGRPVRCVRSGGR